MRKFFRSQRVERGLQVAGLFLAFSLSYGFLRSIGPLRGVVGYIEHGVLVAGTRMGNVVGRIMTSDEAISTKLATCKDQLMASATTISSLASQADDVAELQQLIGYVAEQSVEAIPARIILRALPDAGTVTIDKGSDDRIRKGDAVVVGEGHLLGQVIDVDAQSSMVRLIHSDMSKVPGAIFGRERTIGLIEGQGGTLVRMDYIPEGTNIDVGDIVATSGLDGALPPNLVIGIVTEIVQEDTAPFMQALVEPLYDARTWTNVLVMRTVIQGL